MSAFDLIIRRRNANDTDYEDVQLSMADFLKMLQSPPKALTPEEMEKRTKELVEKREKDLQHQREEGKKFRAEQDKEVEERLRPEMLTRRDTRNNDPESFGNRGGPVRRDEDKHATGNKPTNVTHDRLVHERGEKDLVGKQGPLISVGEKKIAPADINTGGSPGVVKPSVNPGQLKPGESPVKVDTGPNKPLNPPTGSMITSKTP